VKFRLLTMKFHLLREFGVKKVTYFLAHSTISFHHLFAMFLRAEMVKGPFCWLGPAEKFHPKSM
jgi:hypothetical protein